MTTGVDMQMSIVVMRAYTRAQVEQLAFAPANMVPGIEPSPDKMLQGKLHGQLMRIVC